MTLRDATGSVQIIAERDRFLEAEWQEIRRVKPPRRVTIDGDVGVSSTGTPSVFLSEPVKQQEHDLGASIAESAGDYAQVGMQIFLARLRNRASEFFRGIEYLEIEPKLISATWKSPGLEPLRVQYQGFGFPAYLAPSPASQLLDALVATGVLRVFSVSRCFTTTYRDEKSSAESLLLSAKALNVEDHEHRNSAARAVNYVLGGFETLPEGLGEPSPRWRIEEAEWSMAGQRAEVGEPTIEVYAQPRLRVQEGDRSAIEEIFRLVLPPRRVVAEGSRERLDMGLAVASTTLHLERMVSLLRDIPIRQIRHLGGRVPDVRGDEA